MTPCKHCGGAARPRRSDHGCIPQTCDECRKRVKAAYNRRYYRLQLETDAEGFRAYRRQYGLDWRDRLRGGPKPGLSDKPETVARRLRRWRQAEGVGA